MELALNEFVAAVVWASVLLVAFMSVVSRFLHERAERRITGSRIACRLCGRVFISTDSGKFAHCTSCGHPNLSRRNGNLG